MIGKAMDQFAGSGVSIDRDGRLCLPDDLDADRVHRFIEMCLDRPFESPKAALRELFQKVGISAGAISALEEILGEQGHLDWAAIGRSPLKLSTHLPQFLEIPARFRSFLIHDLALAEPGGATLQEAVVATRLGAAARIGCKPSWDAILARPREVGELARRWRRSVV
jgi:hypothetical protein